MSVFIAPSKEEKIKNRLDYAIDKSKLVRRPDGLFDYSYGLDLSDLNLKSFFDIPYRFHTIYGDLVCSSNRLISLKGCPQIIDGGFDCAYNLLNSLEYGPKKIIGNYCCSNNGLESLKGIPNKIHGWLDCSYNRLISLEGCPEEIHGHFDCSDNQLESLNGCPKFIAKHFRCRYNPVKFCRDDIEKVCKVKESIFCDYNQPQYEVKIQ